MTPLEDLRVDRTDDGVVVVTLDLPERRNSMSEAMTRSWAGAMTDLRADRSVRVVVVTGAGSAFCAGGDLSWLASARDATVDDLRARMRPFYEAWLSVRLLEVPTIAAVNGPAIGAGLAVALACDLRYADETARMAMPFTSLGMHPGMASTWLLPEVVGLPAAREMLLTGRSASGAEAVALGLVNRVVASGAALEEALVVARQVAATAPLAARLTKQALAGGGHASFEAALEWESLAQPVTMASQDLQEGLTAQRERRTPGFTGR